MPALRESPNQPTPERQAESEPPLSRVLGLLLGIAGMALYLGGVQLAWRGKMGTFDELGGMEFWRFGPALTGIGCMLFCAACALIWQLSLKRLILLVLISGIMIWCASDVGKRTGRDSIERQKRLESFNP